MEKFLEKISAYQFLNYMIPGTLFLVLIDVLSIYDLPLDNVLLVLLGGYFSGMVLSRIGSLLIEKCLRKWKFVVLAPYGKFKDAEAKDLKITTLSTENNTYRTFLTMFLTLLILYGMSLIPGVKGFMHTQWMALIVIAGLTILFLFAYRKQTNYVRKSVEYIVEKEKNKEEKD